MLENISVRLACVSIVFASVAVSLQYLRADTVKQRLVEQPVQQAPLIEAPHVITAGRPEPGAAAAIGFDPSSQDIGAKLTALNQRLKRAQTTKVQIDIIKEMMPLIIIFHEETEQKLTEQEIQIIALRRRLAASVKSGE